MLDKEFFGWVSLAIALAGYLPYFWSIFKGKTRPHIFSWLIWGMLTAIAFMAQWSDHAGPGAWVTGVTAGFCFLIALLSWRHGEKNICRTDWFSFMSALAAIFLWTITKNPLGAVILVTVTDMLGFYPTFRKSYSKPHEELAWHYFLASFKFIVAFFAFENFTVVTVLYPLSLVIMNGSFVVMLVWRRHHIRKTI